MTLSPETLAAIVAALTSLTTACCTGTVTLLGGIGALYVALRRAQADARKARAEANKEETRTTLDAKRGELLIRKDEMDLLRGELQRQYAVIGKAEERVRAVEDENLRLRNDLNATRDAAADTSRALVDAQDAIKEQAAEMTEKTSALSFVIDQNRLFRRALREAGRPIPVMKRQGDEQLLERLAPDLLADSATDTPTGGA